MPDQTLTKLIEDILTVASDLREEIPTESNIEINFPSTWGLSIDIDDLGLDTDQIASAIVDNFDTRTTIEDAVDAAMSNVDLDSTDACRNLLDNYTEDVTINENVGRTALEHAIEIQALAEQLGTYLNVASVMDPEDEIKPMAEYLESVAKADARIKAEPEPVNSTVTTIGTVKAVLPAEAGIRLALIALPDNDIRVVTGSAVSIYVLD